MQFRNFYGVRGEIPVDKPYFGTAVVRCNLN